MKTITILTSLLIGFNFLPGLSQASNQGGLPACQAKVAQLQAQNAACQTEVAELQAQNAALQNELQAKNNQIAYLQNQIATLEEATELQAQQIAELQAHNAELETQLAELQGKSFVRQTGQIQCWDENPNPVNCEGTGQDGDVQAGVPNPAPRFVDNGDGTVSDKLTDLIWLKDASCNALGPNGDGSANWHEALAAANNLTAGDCSLVDGSVAGDWRLPNVNELQSLINHGFVHPALSNTAGDVQWSEGDPFIGVQSAVGVYYWTSTSTVGNPNYAWDVLLIRGNVYDDFKGYDRFVWPVRDRK